MAVNFPKTGDMTEQMARVAAADIAARVGEGEGGGHRAIGRCVLDMGDRGAHMAVDPVRPPRNTVPTVSQGRRWLLAKRVFRAGLPFLWHAKPVRRMPTTLGW